MPGKHAQEWSGVSLRPAAMYGIRIYTTGSVLLEHLDIAGSHVISAISNVDQRADAPWPLSVVDHEGVRHFVSQAPGEVIMYEGSTCPHGRIKRLQGRYMANLFVHFAPVPL